MGILEQILENQKTMMEMLEGMNAPAGTTSKPAAEKKAEKKTPAKKPAAKKEEKAESEFTAEDVRGRFLAIQEKHGDDAAKAAIKEAGHKKLAEVIADAERWDEIMEIAQKHLDAEEEDDNGGL